MLTGLVVGAAFAIVGSAVVAYVLVRLARRERARGTNPPQSSNKGP